MFRQALKIYVDEDAGSIPAIPLSQWYPVIASIYEQMSWVVLDFEETPFTLFRSDSEEYERSIDYVFPNSESIWPWLIVYRDKTMSDEYIRLWEGSWSKHFGITQQVKNKLIDHLSKRPKSTAQEITKWLFKHSSVYIANVDARYWLLSCDNLDVVFSLLKESTSLNFRIMDFQEALIS